MDLLRRGSRGPQVEMLQLALNRAGYQTGVPDGIFGANTENAVIRFQRANGLSPDGIVGPQTWKKLRPYLTGYFTYRIQPGDTFYRLAKRYGITTQAILTANPEADPLRLQAGQQIVIPLAFDIVPETIRFSFELAELCIEGIQARYPFVGTGRIGRSVLGRPLYELRIGNGPSHVMYNASHHANEWITSPVIMKYAEQLAKQYAFGGTLSGTPAAQVYAHATIHLIPMVNPDGVDLVTGAIAPGTAAYAAAAALAANYPDIAFPNGWKANISGVDLNLNYPAGWEQARDIKFAQGFTMPGPRDYVGPFALSEPESRAMADYTSANQFLLTLSYHTQGEVIYWKYLDYQPPNSYEIGARLSEASGYTLELTPSASGYAGYKDWFIETYNRPGYTIEAGYGVNPLPLSQFARIYADNEPLMTVAALQV